MMYYDLLVTNMAKYVIHFIIKIWCDTSVLRSINY